MSAPDPRRGTGDPKVSVCIITYNHERFIAQAVEGAMMQETTFDFEVVVGEDCSTDGTRSVLLDLQRKYPDRLRLLLRDPNIGMLRNFVSTFEACRGQYVALLEGDDYWTAPEKLQVQADLLDANPEHAACAHNAMVYVESEQRTTCIYGTILQSTIDLAQLVAENRIATCSVMARNGLIHEFPDWFWSLPWGDWAFHVLTAEHGSFAYIDRIMAVYRVHDGGFYSSMDVIKRLEGQIRTWDRFDRYFEGRYRRQIDVARHPIRVALAEECCRPGGVPRGTRVMWARLFHALGMGHVRYQDVVKSLMRVYAPSTYGRLRDLHLVERPIRRP